MRAELDRITAPWLALRGRAHSERPAYRVALLGAHGALRRLGTASELARFLWEGRSRRDWLPWLTSCSRMSIALTRRIDVEPDQPLVVYTPRPEDRGVESTP